MDKKHTPIACISKAALFADLSKAMKEKIVPITTHQQYFPKGSLIRQPLDGKDGMLVIDRGSAKVYNLNEDGKETILGILNQGDIEGQQNLFKQESNENFIQALQDTWICSMNRRDFQNLLKATPELAVTMLNDFGKKLVTIERDMAIRKSLDAKGRLMARLHDLAKDQGTNYVTLLLKKKDLASYLGITPETLSRQFKILEKEKKIEVHGKRVKILE